MKLKIRNKREAVFCWGYLCREFNGFTELPNDLNSAKDKILTTLERYQIKTGEIIEDDIISKCSESLLTDNEIVWINDNDDRLINWLWYTIKSYTSIYNLLHDITKKNYYPMPESIRQKNNSNMEDILDKFNLNKSPSSIIEKKDIIIKYFDLLFLPKTEKIKIFNIFKEKWETIKSFDTFNWLEDKNNNYSEWALNYLDTYKSNKPYSFPNINDFSIESDKLKFILLFDIWKVPSDTKKLFLQSMKKALYQKKFRDKQVDKKQCSFNLSEDIIKKLSFLSNIKDKQKNKILEELILKEYKKETENFIV